ncbi:MAG: hypothetical protein Q8O84_04525 [Nanoarchaeota archaeon]|nr:hypothetical protein [Nanoarchaeota archaeon]
MLNKRGQITIFIIVAILIIGAVALFFTLRGNLQISKPSNPEVAPIKNFVDECIDGVGEEVIYNVGQSGGYYFPPEKSTETGITYYLINNKSYMPSKEKVESEISFFVSNKLFFCTRNFVDFPEYEISQGKIRTETEILENEVVLNVEYPLSIKKGESVSKIKDFEIEIPIRTGLVYDSVSGFIAENNEQGICLSCLSNISETHDLFVDMFDYDNETIIFIFKDENSIINEKPFEWVFANKY